MHGKPGLISSFQTGLHGDHLLQGFRFLFLHSIVYLILGSS